MAYLSNLTGTNGKWLINSVNVLITEENHTPLICTVDWYNTKCPLHCCWEGTAFLSSCEVLSNPPCLQLSKDMNRMPFRPTCILWLILPLFFIHVSSFLPSIFLVMIVLMHQCLSLETSFHLLELVTSYSIQFS